MACPLAGHRLPLQRRWCDFGLHLQEHLGAANDAHTDEGLCLSPACSGPQMSGPSTIRARFRSLHDSGCFVIPNPWDPGSVRALEGLGFAAVATTSAGFAFSRALPDAAGALDVGSVIAHVADVVASANVPVNADFQAGYAADAEGVAANVRRCVETGVAGLSIEDIAADGSLFAPEAAVQRISAARAAIDATGEDVLLTGRAECYLHGHPDPLDEAIRRLTAYSEAGADVLFAPGVRERDHIRAIVDAVAPKPVNVLISADIGLRVDDLAELGVRRVSVGSALARVAWGAFLRAARQIATDGSFAGLDGAASFAELNAMFTDPGGAPPDAGA
jgi:2-methylisocitrate lyase-like PEP mutase family enzyme